MVRSLPFLPIYVLVCNLSIFPFRRFAIVVIAVVRRVVCVLGLSRFPRPSVASGLYRLWQRRPHRHLSSLRFVMTAQLVRAAFWRPGIAGFSSTPFPHHPQTGRA